jgi:hypothetical protein
MKGAGRLRSKLVRLREQRRLRGDSKAMQTKRAIKWAATGLAGLFVVVFILLSAAAGGPQNVYGLVRYARPLMHRGDLRVGDRAPDVKLYALDGTTSVHLRDRLGARPLVLIFGSYT